MPKISIVMSAYNDSNYIEQSIRSIKNQSFIDWELIVIDDASRDDTWQKILNLASNDKRIRVFKNEINKGLTKNLNYGIGLAEGKYIARLDSDDIWTDVNKLIEQINFLEQNNEYALVGTYSEVIDKNNNILSIIKYPIENKDIRKRILVSNCFVHSSVMFRNMVEFRYPEEDKFVEDYGLWLKIGEKYKIHNIPKYMVQYRFNESGITQNKNLVQISNVIKLIRKHKQSYSNYFKAILKWHIQFLVTTVFGSIKLHKIKFSFRGK